jgi:hypothetical protein
VARTNAAPWFVASHNGVVAGLNAVDRFVGTFRGDTATLSSRDNAIALANLAVMWSTAARLQPVWKLRHLESTTTGNAAPGSPG